MLNSSNKNKKSTPWRVVIIIIIALAILIGISFLPLEKWSGGAISDINLFADILDLPLPEEKDAPDAYIDPMLEEDIEPVKVDTRAVDTAGVAQDEKPLIAVQPSRQGDLVVIEDYTDHGDGLQNLRDAINSGRMARIAVIGDSYIEGDIFTEDLRELLQQKYGGTGVGYVNMHSELTGFRKSVRQGGGTGWKEYAANGKHDGKYMGLTQHYYKLNSPTKSTYSGVTAYSNLDKWNRSRFVFLSPLDTEITVTTSDSTYTIPVAGSNEVQSITINGPTNKFNVEASSNSLIGFGVWLTDSVGVNVDCMSSRGFSGVTLTKVDPTLAQQMQKHIDYDLIILEFGINAMSAKQKDYSNYQRKMEIVVDHVRACYPNADILLMGIGDRSAKRGTEYHSMSSAPFMVTAQREAARHARCMFWDTREAMGGEESIIEWVRNGWVNKDYIHMNHKGGRQLAIPLFNAIEHNLNDK